MDRQSWEDKFYTLLIDACGAPKQSADGPLYGGFVVRFFAKDDSDVEVIVHEPKLQKRGLSTVEGITYTARLDDDPAEAARAVGDWILTQDDDM